MFRRKLEALDYLKRNDFNIRSQTDFQELIVWLEDKKIRHYPIEDREALRQIDNPDWNTTFSKYLKDLKCPVEMSDDKAVCDWLLGIAVGLEYDDNIEKYRGITSEAVKENLKNAPEIEHENPLDKFDFESAEFKDGVNALAKLLDVTPHPDHLVTLEALSLLITARYKLSDFQNAKAITGKQFSLDEIRLGFDTKDPILNEASKILRLLYMQDLRNLQTKINEVMVKCQSVTANPKTDTRLGKVGR